jgi:hypothetical protein
MAGRKPLGPGLVEHLEGSASAKERLELILATIAGQVTVVSAAEQLGLSEAMFYKLRNRVLQLSLEDLEPKPLGRPAQVASEAAQQQAAWAARVAELERELQAQSVRLEVAQILPRVIHSAEPLAVKKTPRQIQLERKRRRRRARPKK